MTSSLHYRARVLLGREERVPRVVLWGARHSTDLAFGGRRDRRLARMLDRQARAFAALRACMVRAELTLRGDRALLDELRRVERRVVELAHPTRDAVDAMHSAHDAYRRAQVPARRVGA